MVLNLGGGTDTVGDRRLMSRVQTVKLFSRSLELGTKFIYQAMPRMLTIWLEAGEDPEVLEYVKRHKKEYASFFSLSSALITWQH